MLDIAEHYKKLLEQYGDGPEAAQYSDQVTQERRFEELAKIGSLEGMRILDFGCGTAHFATWLKKKGYSVNYTGVDIVEEFFAVARNKHPDHRFGTLADFSAETFDYCFVSGVFNNRHNQNHEFYQGTVLDLFQRASKGVAFNMMSTYVDYQDPGLFYEDPCRAFEFVKRQVTPLVTLRHDYQIKKGIIPFEFLVYAYRSEGI